MVAYALDGWELLVAIIAILIFVTVIALILIGRESKSRKVRFGIFVEREYDDGRRDDSEWPTQH